ncbi:MAG: hypothetical protein AMK73_05745 [Planctomycetes bacterium SM23_32]|nr:MAG: hypothetical protein AMK73_05745 [Planctomycetes bacterium SM23_32]
MRPAALSSLVLALASVFAGCAPEPESASDLLEQAWRAYSTGDFDIAVDRFEGLKQNGGLTAEQRYSALLGLATTYHYRPNADLDAAAENYALLGVLEQEPAKRQSALGLARVALAGGNLLEGQSKLTDLIAAYPGSMEADEAVLQLADSLLRPDVVEEHRGEFKLPTPGAEDRALSALEHRLGTNPHNRLAPAMHMMAADAYIQARRFDEAVGHLIAAEQEGISVVKTRGTVLWKIASIAESELGDLALAEKYYDLYATEFSRTELYYRATKRLERVRALRAEQGG